MKQLLLTVLALAFLATPAAASAQGLDVQFENDPLFSEGDIKPGDCYAAEFSVENESDTPADGYLRTLDGEQTRELATVLDITIIDTETEETLYADTLAELFARDTDEESVFLGSVAGGESRNFSVEACFPADSGNEFQLGTADFDLCVGFSGGEESCTGENDGGGGEEGADDGDDTNDGTGGGGGGGDSLPDRDGDGTPDSQDSEPDNPEVAGVATTSPPDSNFAGLLNDLEDRLRGLLASLAGGQVAGALDRRAPTLPSAGDGSLVNYLEGRGVSTDNLAAVLAGLATFFAGLLGLSLYRRRREQAK